MKERPDVYELSIYTEPTLSFVVVRGGEKYVYELSESVVREMKEHDLDPQAWAEKWHDELEVMHTGSSESLDSWLDDYC